MTQNQIEKVYAVVKEDKLTQSICNRLGISIDTTIEQAGLKEYRIYEIFDDYRVNGMACYTAYRLFVQLAFKSIINKKVNILSSEYTISRFELDDASIELFLTSLTGADIKLHFRYINYVRFLDYLMIDYEDRSKLVIKDLESVGLILDQYYINFGDKRIEELKNADKIIKLADILNKSFFKEVEDAINNDPKINTDVKKYLALIRADEYGDFWDCYGPENDDLVRDRVAIWGNEDYKGYNSSMVDGVIAILDDLHYDLETVDDDYSDGNITLQQVPEEKRKLIKDYIHRYDNLIDVKSYTNTDLDKLVKLSEQWTGGNQKEQFSAIIDFLTIVYKEPFEYKQINGYSQSDYNYVWYPMATNEDYITWLSALYMGTGCEVEISNEKLPIMEYDEVLDLNRDRWDSYFIPEDYDTRIRKHLADETGYNPNEIYIIMEN